MAINEEKFIAFHSLASQRKLDLAVRGLDVPNLPIDDLFEEAERKSVRLDAWSDFLRERLPSPRIVDLAARAANDTAAEAHRLRHVADLMSSCCLGEDDIAVDALLAMGSSFVRVLEGVGTFASLSLQEATNNLQKIRDGCAAVGVTRGSLLTALRSERQAGLHGRGGLLKDPSAAMGVLWIARFLAFWEEICLMRAQPPPPDGDEPSLRATIDGAYQHTLLPYHGWVTEKAFSVAVATTPEWPEVRPVFAPSDADFRADFAVFLPHSQALLQRINAALTHLDLVDTRKSV